MTLIVRTWRFARWFVLLALVAAIVLALRKPATPDLPDEAARPVLAQKFEAKLTDVASARQRGEATEARFTSDEVNAALAQSLAQSPLPASATAPPEDASQAQVKDVRVIFEDDQITGYFLTDFHGKDLYLTVSGHLGVRDGHVTFEPTEFKVGQLSVPVSLVNPELQKKLEAPENRDKLKLPEFVSDLRVEDGRMVVTGK